MSECIGITKLRKICGKKLKGESDFLFCDQHKDQDKLHPTILQGILNGTNKEYKLGNGRCNHWHKEDTIMCLPCVEQVKGYTEKRKAQKIRCIWKQKDGLPCKKSPVDDKCVCCDDHVYAEKYTKKMVEECDFCTGSCGRFIYIEGDFKSCDDCRMVGKKNREKARENEKRKMCLTEGCTYHENLENGNGYCAKCDEPEMKKKSIIASGKKICKRWHHSKNCLETLEFDDNDICLECSKNSNISQITKIINIKKKAEIMNIANVEILKTVEIQRKIKYESDKFNKKVINVNQLIDNESDNYFIEDGNSDELIYQLIDETKCFKICTNKNCGKPFDLTHFVGPNLEITVECQTCRGKNRVICDGRERTPYIADPERIKAKQDRQNEYRKNNKVLMSMRDKYYRLLEQEKLGTDEYHKKKADEAKEYRKKNKEKFKFLNKIRNADPRHRLEYYQYRAKMCNIKWTLLESVAISFFQSNCHYCGDIDVNNLSGIDRMNNNESYHNSNVVPCCEMCNFMKCEINYDDYLKIIKHIMTHMITLFEDFNCENLFEDHCSASLKQYSDRAIKKEISFELSDVEFSLMKISKCYMCGKSTDDIHINGIDRIDNTKGYYLDNCLSCCGTCNKIKNKFDIFDMCRKMYKTVCKHNKLQIGDLNEVNELVKQHLELEKDNLKGIINNCNNDKINVVVNLDNKIIIDNDSSEDEKPKKIKKHKVDNVEIIKKSDNKNIADKNNDSDDEKPKKIKKVNIAEKVNIVEKLDDGKKLTTLDKLKTVIANVKERTGEEHVDMSKVNILEELGINPTTVRNQLTKKNNTKKYGEDGYVKLEALRKAKQRATKKGDNNKAKEMEDEINAIKIGAIKPGKKIKLTEEQKREKKTIQKQKQRDTEKEKWGVDAIRERQAKEKHQQREKQKKDN